MKIIAMLMLGCCLGLSAATYSQTITLKGDNMALRDVFVQVQAQSGYRVLVNKALLENAKPVSVAAEDMPLEEFLKTALESQRLDYRLEGKNIFLSRKEGEGTANARDAGVANAGLTGNYVLAFPEVKGKVVDSVGQPLSGASIRVLNSEGKRTSLQTTTNHEGNFTLHNVPEDARLEITYIGYTAQTVPARPNVGPITLQAIPSALEEVTVSTGYWQMSQRLSTGNIAKVSAEEIARQPVGNPLSTLEGKVPGLVITQTTGLPGGQIKVELRGRTAIDRNITDDQPLFIIDDVPYGPNNGVLSTTFSALGRTDGMESLYGGTSPLNSLNPADIESIEVLKDADATAIYGSRGANGVIRITTKKGKAGKTKVDFNAYTGLGSVARPLEMMDTRQYVALRRQAFVNSGITPTPANAYDLLVWDTTRNTDFVDLLAGNTAHTYQSQLSISGGNNQTQFLVSGNFRKETTIMPGDDGNNRNGINFQLSHQSTDRKFKLVFGGTYNIDRNNLITQDPMTAMRLKIPNMLLYNSDGSLAWNEGGYRANNPVALMESKYRADGNLAQGNLQLVYTILPALVVKTNFGYSRSQLDEQNHSPAVAINPLDLIERIVNVNSNRFQSYIVEPQLDYRLDKSFGNIDMLVGGTWQQTDNDGSQLNAMGFGTDDLMSSIGAATDYMATNNYARYRYAAVFGRIGYDWRNKYLLNLSARRDGSSRFGDGRQFANFGAIGAAWIFSEERWVKNTLPFLSFGKFRGSIGLTGNDKITNYQYLDTWAVTPSPYNGVAGLYPNKLYNPDYRWEKTTKWEGALDIGFLNDRLSLSVVYFQHQSSNQLTNYRLPVTSGFPTVVANLPATVRNSGWEFVLSTTNIQSADFRWTTAVNATLPNNRLIAFPGLALSSYANTFVEGQPLNLIRGYRYTGVDRQSGLYTFEDADGNGAYSTADYRIIGDLDPELFGGVQNSLRYKDVELNLLFSFRQQMGRNYLASISITPGAINNNLPAGMTGFWQQPGDDAKLQKPTSASSPEFQRFIYSSGVYSDASFARLRNVELAYRLPPSWSARLKLQQARIYAQGQNLFTFTNYEIGDPETQWLTRTPPLRVFSFGFQLTL